MPPVFALLAALVAGIVASPTLDLEAIRICLVPSAVVAWVRPRTIVLLLFIIGAWRAGRSDPPPVPDYPVRLVAALESEPRPREGGVYLNVRVRSLDGIPISGRARLTEFLDQPELERLFAALDLGSGDEIEVLVRLHRPSVFKTPGVFDYRRYLENQGIFWTGTIRNPRLIEVRRRGWHGPDRARRWLRSRIDAAFGSAEGEKGIVLAMVFGDKLALPAGVEDRYRRTGLYHLLVVSGFNLAVLAWVTGGFLGLLSIQRGLRIVIVVFVAAGYSIVADGQAPILRATVVVILWGFCRILDRDRDGARITTVAAGVMILWDPWVIFDPSFQMTFAAVAGLLVLAAPLGRLIFGDVQRGLDRIGDVSRDGWLEPAIADWRVRRRLWCELHGLPLWTLTIPWRLLIVLGEAVMATICVEMAMAYLMVESFHRLAPISLVLNLPGGLIASAVTPVGLVLPFLPDAFARPAAWALAVLIRMFDFAVTAGSTVQFGSILTPSPPGMVWIAFALGLAWTVVAVRHDSRLRAVLGLLLCALLQCWIVLGNFDAGVALPQVTFLDVGQGDSILIEEPPGRRTLIDGGGIAAGRFLSLRDDRSFSVGETVVSAHLLSRGIRRVDRVVLTHAHHDHLDGLFDVVRNFEVGEVVLGRNPDTPRYLAFLDAIESRRIPVRWVCAGDAVTALDVLHPPCDWRVREQASNDDSLVMRWRSGPSSVLLTGDLQRGLGPGQPEVTVLKVPHHGSRSSKIRINFALRVISVGANNPFGHPHRQSLPALRTDVLGTVRMTFVPGVERPRIEFPGLR